jgi:hypothetical protein
MPTVTIFRFKKYNINSDEYQISRRWATREALTRIRGEPLEDTAVEVDVAVLSREIEGMTDRDFDPHSRTGFQRQVTDFNPFKTTNAAGSFRASSFEDQ